MGGRELAIALSKNSSVEDLNLSKNNIDDETAKEFIETLKYNTTLQNISLKKCCISIKLINEIKSATLKNRERANNNIKPKCIAEIVSMANDKNDFYEVVNEIN